MVQRIRIDDAQRRARLVSRHRLGPHAASVDALVEDLVAVHASDPVTPYLAARARLPDFSTPDLDAAVYERRSLWRLHAMRRTIFLVPAADREVFDAAAGRDVARRERRRLEKWLASEMPAGHVVDWLADVEARTVAAIADGEELSTRELTTAISELSTRITTGSGRWAQRSPLSSRLLFLLAMDGRVVRTRPAGSWRSSQYRWAASDAWFDHRREPLEPEAARTELLRRYLAAHGPATTADVRWWTGWTVTHTRAALADVGAVTVDLESGEGHVLGDDLDEGAPTPPSRAAALLPGLDPTVMGWHERDWYLGDRAEALFDTGNAGPTVWLDGRVVGGWAQRPDGEVVVGLLTDVGAEGREAITAEAAAVTAWLDGVVVSARFPTPLVRELSR